MNQKIPKFQDFKKLGQWIPPPSGGTNLYDSNNPENTGFYEAGGNGYHPLPGVRTSVNQKSRKYGIL